MDVYDFPFTYRGLTLNRHRASDGTLVTANENDTARINAFDWSRLQQRDQREALHLLSGGDLGDATIAFRYLALSGTVKAPSGGALDDRIAAILAAFDVEEAQLASVSTEGVLPLDFTGVTTITTGRGTAFTDKQGQAYQYVPERFYARPAAYPIITGRRSGGDAATFAIELVCPDRRRYIQTAETPVANSGNGFNVALPNWSATTGISVPPQLAIVMSGAGSATLTITLNGVSLVLNMSAESAGTFNIDCATGLITKGSTPRADLRVSGVTTPFLLVPAGGANLVITNTTNVTSVTATYRQARG